MHDTALRQVPEQAVAAKGVESPSSLAQQIVAFLEVILSQSSQQRAELAAAGERAAGMVAGPLTASSA